MNSKRGLSSVVVTVLLILFSVLAIVIISSFIIPFIRDNLKESAECLNYGEYFTFDDGVGFNCYVVGGGNKNYTFSLLADSVNEEAEEKVVGMKVAFTREGENDVVEFIAGDEVNRTNVPYIRMLDDSVTLMSIPGRGEVKTYVYVSDKDYREISVAPLLDSGRLCDVSDTLRIEDKIC